MLLIDNSWAAAPDWDRRAKTAEALIDDAEAGGVPVAIAFAADRSHDAVARHRRQCPRPAACRSPPAAHRRSRTRTASGQDGAGRHASRHLCLPFGRYRREDNDDIVAQIAALQPAELRLIEGDGKETVAITNAVNAANDMTVTATRLNGATPERLALSAMDAQGRPIAAGTLDFAAGATVATGSIAAPFELRNDFSRVSIDNHATAGAVHLLDEGFKRRRVGILSGQAADEFQPLLVAALLHPAGLAALCRSRRAAGKRSCEIDR